MYYIILRILISSFNNNYIFDSQNSFKNNFIDFKSDYSSIRNTEKNKNNNLYNIESIPKNIEFFPYYNNCHNFRNQNNGVINSNYNNNCTNDFNQNT